MKTVQQAWEILMSFYIRRVRSEVLPIHQAAGKVAFEDVIASSDSPPFSLSRYDGYAMGKSRTAGWYELVTENPLTAGHVFEGILKPGQAMPIMTGAPLPKGTACILPFELCKVSGKRLRPLLSEANNRMVLEKGQNFRKGDRYISSGDRLTPLHIAFLAMDGRLKVKILSKLHLAVISTGDELSNIAEKNLENGHIRNSHPDMLHSMLSGNGILTRSEILRDDPALMKERFVHYLDADDDIIITTGGLGKGTKDFTRKVLKETGCIPLFEGIFAKPVGTFSVYSANEKIIFSLPGGLISVILLAKLFVEPFIKKIQGYPPLERPGPFFWAKLTGIRSESLCLPVKNKGWVKFVKARCVLQDDSKTLYVTPLISDSLLKLNAFIVIDNRNSPDGKVRVFKLWD